MSTRYSAAAVEELRRLESAEAYRRDDVVASVDEGRGVSPVAVTVAAATEVAYTRLVRGSREVSAAYLLSYASPLVSGAGVNESVIPSLSSESSGSVEEDGAKGMGISRLTAASWREDAILDGEASEEMYMASEVIGRVAAMRDKDGNSNSTILNGGETGTSGADSVSSSTGVAVSGRMSTERLDLAGASSEEGTDIAVRVARRDIEDAEAVASSVDSKVADRSSSVESSQTTSKARRCTGGVEEDVRSSTSRRSGHDWETGSCNSTELESKSMSSTGGDTKSGVVNNSASDSYTSPSDLTSDSDVTGKADDDSS